MIRTLVRRATILACAHVALAVFAASALAAAPPKGSAPAGKAIYDVKCVSCHKLDGSGGIPLGTGKTPNWTSAATWTDPRRKDMDAYLRNAIANGDLPKGMVPFVKSGQLKPVEVEHLIAHIHALAKKK